MHAPKGKKKKMTRDQCNAKTNTHTHTHYPRTRNLLHSTAAHIISMHPGEANEEEAQEEGKYLRTKLTTSRRESLLEHCRKSHRERQSQREREREKSVTRLSTNIETSEKIKSFYIMTKEGQKRELRWGCEKQKKHKEGR
jgi:aromatic ring hydroxylase